MPVILAFVLLFVAAPAVAQPNVADLPPDYLTANPLVAWKVEAQSSSPVEQMQLALRWARQPSDLQARSSEDRSSRRSTVGQGSH